ncbi:MAG: ZIP family metal transporter [Bdellovibrionota bacterium]
MAAVIFDGIAGLSGGVLPTAFVRKHITALLAFAAGTLIGASFLELLPGAFASQVPYQQILLAVLVGFAGFYVVETFLGSHAAGQSGHKHSAIGPLILVGDALHNAADGIAIAAAFMADIKTGIATSLAVIVHEVPQEIGDYAILISHGYSRKKALLLLIIVQFAALFGALFALGLSHITATISPFLMALSAGGFIYIAAADLLPELQRRKDTKRRFVKFISFCAGVGIIGLIKLFLHDH